LKTCAIRLGALLTQKNYVNDGRLNDVPKSQEELTVMSNE